MGNDHGLNEVTMLHPGFYERSPECSPDTSPAQGSGSR